jgi:KipI family sensor histidine kinase inhibitor
MNARYLSAGGSGLIAELGNAICPEVNTQVRALAVGIEAARIPGIIEVIPTYRSLGIEYDPLVTSFEDLARRVREVASRIDSTPLPPPTRLSVPTVYGGTYGPDLSSVAQHADLSESEVIRLHSQATYHVYMIGFTPGYPYLGGLPERLHTPRLSSPRLKVPKGSVGIGGSQAGIYPLESPGGWRIIGRTYLNFFDPRKNIPTPIQPGDTVQFVPVTEEEYLRAEDRGRGTEDGGPRTGDGGPRAGGGKTKGQEIPYHERSHSRLSALGSRDAIEVLRPGILTTVQDRGRFGYQKFGVPVSGGMDEIALRVANALVGNTQGAAGLEITAMGPQLRFPADTVVALTGAEVDAALDGRPVPWYTSFRIRAGQVLDVRNCLRGLRAYLAVAGGIDVPVLLGSRSTCLVAGFGGLHGRALVAGDVLPVENPAALLSDLVDREVPLARRPRHPSSVRLRVVLGPQDDAFTDEGRHTFLESVYRVTPEADRMGYRLDGPRVAHSGAPDIISDWIPLGAVQVPGNGRPIILLADRQTTGGYAKIATVIRPDLSLVAQLRPGDAVSFQAVSMGEARAIVREVEAGLRALLAHLARPDTWAYAARLGDVPAGISPSVLELAPGAFQAMVEEPSRVTVRSPMAAVVAKVLVGTGATVAQGQSLFLVQAMKMEFEVAASRGGRLLQVHVGEGDAVGAGDVMATLDTST